METNNSKIAFVANCSNVFTKVNHFETMPLKISGDYDAKLYPGEFPYCGNCIHYSGPKVCPVAGVYVNHTSDGTGCVMTGVYQKKTCTKDSVM